MTGVRSAPQCATCEHGAVIGDVLWTPPADVRETTELGRFLDFVRDERGDDFGGYDDLWRWSVDDLEGFWGAVWDFFDVGERTGPVLADGSMPGARWFLDVKLNYAEYA